MNEYVMCIPYSVDMIGGTGFNPGTGTFDINGYTFTGGEKAVNTGPINIPAPPYTLTFTIKLTASPTADDTLLFIFEDESEANGIIIQVKSLSNYLRIGIVKNWAWTDYTTTAALPMDTSTQVNIDLTVTGIDIKIGTASVESIGYSTPLPVAFISGVDDFVFGSKLNNAMEGIFTSLTITPGSSGTGDPVFIGFHQQQFQIHGIPESYFNIISNPYLHVNAKFIYLDKSNNKCQYNYTQCWTHPGTYMDAFGITLIDERNNNNKSTLISIVSGSYPYGFSNVTLNNIAIHVDDHITMIDDSSYLHYHDINHVTLHTKELTLSFINSDRFINIHAQMASHIIMGGQKLLKIDTTDSDIIQKQLNEAYPIQYQWHGFVGQTWRNIVWPHGHLYEGSVDDYLCTSQFEHDSYFNTFQD